MDGSLMVGVKTYPNRELQIVDGNKSRWSHADCRRHGWHNLHSLARYCMSFRAARVMQLEKRMDLGIAELDSVKHLTSLPWFSAMVVIHGQHILFERYAPDFGPDRPHSIQSITKTMMNLVIGRLVEQGTLDLSREASAYIPEIGSGYASATLQQILNMDVSNDYSEDFADPRATYYQHEEAMGWRLPADPAHEKTQRQFLVGISSRDTANRSGYAQYKDANTDVLGWIVERVTGRSLRSFIAEMVDAAGLEGTYYITTDRDGCPALDGGASLSARDLARYFALFVRRGRGVDGQIVGGPKFIEQTLPSGIPMPSPLDWIRYSNHTLTLGHALGHGGWGGQFALANLQTGVIGVFFSVIENQHAITREYLGPIVRMLDSISRRGTAP